MRKELLLAIILGLSLGLIITYGIYRSRNASVNTDQQEVLKASPSPVSETAGNLSILTPKDESIVNQSEINITGLTDPDAYLVIFVNDNENITLADASGNFSLKTNLELGSNVIRVHSLDTDGKKSIEEITIIYEKEVSSDTSSATDSAKEN